MSAGPDYSNYSDDQLLEVYENMDRYRYPEIFERLCAQMREKNLFNEDGHLKRVEREDLDEAPHPMDEFIRPFPEPEYDDDGNYVPNHVPLKYRVGYGILSTGVIIYGLTGYLKMTFMCRVEAVMEFT